MSDAIRGLEPAGVWKYFAEIARIPRPSKHEERIAKYVAESAATLGLEVRRDKVGNVAVALPASPGMEGRPGIVLQGHLDMVCEKNAGTAHDFMKDPIELVRDGNVLRANGTTLGADNGIAVATMLAIMHDRSLKHGPLELLFTIDEETGLTGASELGPGLLKHRTLLNLDSEEEGSVYVGCSGGRDIVGSWKIAGGRVPPGSKFLTISVRGLRGGHSGLEIDKGRGNAIKILVRAVSAAIERGAGLSSIDGGNKRNAIPREAFAVIAAPPKKLRAVRDAVARFDKIVKAELGPAEPGVSVTAEELTKTVPRVFKPEFARRILDVLRALPHGVQKMSPDIPGLVETSSNLAVITTAKGGVRIETSQRSSVSSELDDMQDVTASVFRLGGASIKASQGYPGWKPDLASPMLGRVKQTYRDLFGKDVEVKAIHAGLECGIIGEKYPGMDMVSFGPTLEGVHSPDEKIYIDTVPKYYKLLLEVLARA